MRGGSDPPAGGGGVDRRTAMGTIMLGASATRLSAGIVPGRLNLITDVQGIKVGQAEDCAVRTGVTVITADRAMAAAVDVRGGAPGTRETDALADHDLVHVVDAVVLAGGSVYGLAAADGVAAWLGARRRGFALSPSSEVPPSPIVPAAILFDLDNGGNKSWGMAPPYRALGVAAVEAAAAHFAIGSTGAGFGARSGQLHGGTGSASIRSQDGFTVGAIVAVNSFGSAVAADGRSFWAAPWEIGGEFGARGTAGLSAGDDGWGLTKEKAIAGQNTTIACVATDAALSGSELKRVAIMAHDGLARAIRPVHSPFDGDTVFAVATGDREVTGARPLAVARLGALGADTLARAIARAVFEANRRV